MKLSKKNISGVFIVPIIIIFLISNNSFAQKKSNELSKKDKTVTELATKLQQKLLLTDAQFSKVQEVLTNYKLKPTAENLAKAKKDIEVMFDPRQRAKYSIVNAEWWNSVKKELGSK